MIWNGHGARLALTLLAAGGVIACQSSQSNFQGSNFSDETRTLEKELNAEAVALGTAQGVAGIATAADPTGVSGLVAASAGRAARDALMKSTDERLKAQMACDEQELYRRYGMNPDGTPSGRKPASGQ